MIDPGIYALLAAGSYADIRAGQLPSGTTSDPLNASNRSPLPPGWIELTQYAQNGSGPTAILGGSNGFSARVYQGPDGQIVISYGGTEFPGVDTDNASSAGRNADFLNGNVPLAIGDRSSQELAAANLYLRVKADNPYADIDFTGHSLGGGLAGLMAVYFNEHAYVFDPAPFGFAAAGIFSPIAEVLDLPLNPPGSAVTVRLFSDPANSALAWLRVQLAGRSNVGALSSYNPSTDYEIRIQNVQASTVSGEVLETLLSSPNFRYIQSTTTHLFDDPSNALEAGWKHSIDLLAATELVPDLEVEAGKVPDALTKMFDTTLYGGAPSDNRLIFVNKLVRNEVGVVNPANGTQLVPGNGMLTSFTADLGVLGQIIGGISKSEQDALLAQEIEWYYWQGSDYAGQKFFTPNGNILQYTTATGDGLRGALDKAGSYANAWLDPMLPRSAQRINIDAYQQWSVAVSGGSSAMVQNDLKTQIFVGSDGDDTYTAGSQADLLLGAAGDDRLDGNGGNDRLYGGLGTDTYLFSGQFGKDVVVDQDGLGSIQIGGYFVGQANPNGRDTWRAKLANGDFVDLVVLTDSTSSTGKRLVINQVGDLADTITISNFDLAAAKGDNGYIGIKLSDKLDVAFVAGNTSSPFSVWDFASSSLSAASTLAEKSAQSIKLFFNQAIQAGDTLTMSVKQGAASLLKLVNGADSVDLSSPVTLTLAEGQTDVAFAIEDDQAIDSDQAIELQVTWTHGDTTVNSNTYTVNLQNHDDPTNVITGDITKKLQPDGTTYFLDPNSNYVSDGASPGAQDIIRGTADGDSLSGLGGNDGLSGLGGNDSIEGGDGDDLLLGGAGSDTINGGAGDDVILGSADGPIGAAPNVNSQPPQAQGPEISRGFTWVVYKQGDLYVQGDAKGYNVAGVNALTPDQETTGNVIDGGAGNDRIGAGSADDLVKGGDGNDSIAGMGGADVLMGEAGDDWILGDGIYDPSGQLLWFTAYAQQGDDFIDGGAGNDTMMGQGGDDVLYGGDGSDLMRGDDMFLAQTPLANQGNDYLDGEDGDDTIVGGGKDDTLYGGAGNDQLFHDAPSWLRPSTAITTSNVAGHGLVKYFRRRSDLRSGRALVHGPGRRNAVTFAQPPIYTTSTPAV
jgi:hypothetical protein